MTSLLSTQARIVADTRQQLKDAFGLEDGDEFLEGSLEGVSDLPELLASMAREVRRTEVWARATRDIAKDNLLRAGRLEDRAEKIRASIAWAMSEAGLKRIPADALPDLIVTMREGQRPVKTPDPKMVPHEYCRIKYEPNMIDIRAALESGQTFDWGYLGNSMPILTIRSK